MVKKNQKGAGLQDCSRLCEVRFFFINVKLTVVENFVLENNSYKSHIISVCFNFINCFPSIS